MECSLDRAIKDAFEFHIQRKSLLRDCSVSFNLQEGLRHPPAIHNTVLHCHAPLCNILVPPMNHNIIKISCIQVQFARGKKKPL